MYNMRKGELQFTTAKVAFSTSHPIMNGITPEGSISGSGRSLGVENGNPLQCLEGLRLKLKLQYFGHLMRRADSLEKTLMLGKTEGKKEKGAAEDETVRWHHQLNGHESEQTSGDSEGQGSLACCSS